MGASRARDGGAVEEALPSAEPETERHMESETQESDRDREGERQSTSGRVWETEKRWETDIKEQ